jgi:uncharacterized membrane protein
MNKTTKIYLQPLVVRLPYSIMVLRVLKNLVESLNVSVPDKEVVLSLVGLILFIHYFIKMFVALFQQTFVLDVCIPY